MVMKVAILACVFFFAACSGADAKSVEGCERGEYFVPEDCSQIQSANDCFDAGFDQSTQFFSGNYECLDSQPECLCNRVGKSNNFAYVKNGINESQENTDDGNVIISV